MKKKYTRRELISTVISDLRTLIKLYNKHVAIGNVNSTAAIGGAIQQKVFALNELDIISLDKTMWLSDITKSMRGLYDFKK